jgi:predicted helicase
MMLPIKHEKQEQYALERRETGKLNWRVEKMALSKDKTQLRYNEFLTLSGIPAEVYEYRLGNRSALEWAVDQYRVSTDARSGIVNDPNREDDPEYIVRLVGQVVTVSLETVRLVRELAGLSIDQA